MIEVTLDGQGWTLTVRPTRTIPALRAGHTQYPPRSDLLTGVDYGDGVTQSYSFDNMGNRLTKTEGGTTDTYAYNAANMLVSRNGQAYVNDLNGNTLSGGGRVNTWDSQNRLVQCVFGGNTSQFVYGADGLRRTSIVNGNPVHYVLDSGMMVREMAPSCQTLIPKATYLIGPRGPEYRYDHQTQAIRWYLYDGLGSVLAEVDPGGNLTASRKYDVHGLVRAGDNGTSRHKFVGSLGHTSEDETGLIYMRARWMDPALGRVKSEDPARDGANWLEYCRGNPVNAVDPDVQSGIGLANLEYVLYAMQYVGGLSFAQRIALLTGSPARIYLMLMDMSSLLAARSKGSVQMAALLEGMAAEGEFIGGSFNGQPPAG